MADRRSVASELLIRGSAVICSSSGSIDYVVSSCYCFGPQIGRSIAGKCHTSGLFQQTSVLSFRYSILMWSMSLSKLSYYPQIAAKIDECLGGEFSSFVRSNDLDPMNTLKFLSSLELSKLRQSF